MVDRRSGGYTLIEVLVAMTILALALGVLMRIFGAGLRTVDAAEDYAAAVSLAESRLAATADSLRPGQRQGSHGEFRWQTNVEAYATPGLAAVAAGRINAYRVTVRVEWPAGPAGPRQVTLSTIRLSPGFEA